MCDIVLFIIATILVLGQAGLLFLGYRILQALSAAPTSAEADITARQLIRDVLAGRWAPKTAKRPPSKSRWTIGS